MYTIYSDLVFFREIKKVEAPALAPALAPAPAPTPKYLRRFMRQKNKGKKLKPKFKAQSRNMVIEIHQLSWAFESTCHYDPSY